MVMTPKEFAMSKVRKMQAKAEEMKQQQL